MIGDLLDREVFLYQFAVCVEPRPSGAFSLGSGQRGRRRARSIGIGRRAIVDRHETSGLRNLPTILARGDGSPACHGRSTPLNVFRGHAWAAAWANTSTSERLKAAR